MPTLTVLISSRAGTRSLAGWQCIQHELRRMPPALSGWRPRSPFSRAAAGTRDLAQSQAAEHRPDRRLRRADNVRPRATHGRQGANDVRHHQLHAVGPRNRDNNSEPPAWAASGSERKDPDRSNSRSSPCNPQMCIRRSSIGCNKLRTSPIGLGVGS